MKISIGNLRRIIRNAMQPELSDREQLGKIAKPRDPNEISPHLVEPVYDYEDCYGPVPPQGKNPYTLPDPYNKDTSPLPTSTIKR